MGIKIIPTDAEPQGVLAKGAAAITATGRGWRESFQANAVDYRLHLVDLVVGEAVQGITPAPELFDDSRGAARHLGVGGFGTAEQIVVFTMGKANMAAGVVKAETHQNGASSFDAHRRSAVVAFSRPHGDGNPLLNKTRLCFRISSGVGLAAIRFVNHVTIAVPSRRIPKDYTDWKAHIKTDWSKSGYLRLFFVRY